MAIPFLKGIDVAGTVDLNNLTIDGAQGTDGQVLTSTGSGIAWEDAAGGASLSGGAANKLAIWSGTDALTNDTNLHWDTSNDRLGIGTATPATTLHVNGRTVIGANNTIGSSYVANTNIIGSNNDTADTGVTTSTSVILGDGNGGRYGNVVISERTLKLGTDDVVSSSSSNTTAILDINNSWRASFNYSNVGGFLGYFPPPTTSNEYLFFSANSLNSLSNSTFSAGNAPEAAKLEMEFNPSFGTNSAGNAANALILNAQGNASSAGALYLTASQNNTTSSRGIVTFDLRHRNNNYEPPDGMKMFEITAGWGRTKFVVESGGQNNEASIGIQKDIFHLGDTNTFFGFTGADTFGVTTGGTERLSIGNSGATFSGSVTGSSFVKSGGTSSQFLKADGSVDSSTYLTAHPNISGATSQNNTGNGFIQDLTFDSNGHVTGVVSASVSGFLTSESDTLATVTGRGSSTSTNVTLSGNGNHFSGHHYFDSYDSNGNHYPHYLSGSNNNGAQVNLRVQQSGGSNYDVLYIAAGSNNITWRGNKIWNAGNDGSGSGLDADLLDGNHASAFATSSHNHAASEITSGTFNTARIPNLGAGKITSGTLATARLDSSVLFGNNSSGTNEGNFNNWNDLSKTGFYSDDGATGRWTTDNWSSVMHFRLYDDNNNWASQLGFDTYDTDFYYRRKNNGTWSSWFEVYHEGHKPTWSEIESKPSTFTPSSHNHAASEITSGTFSNRFSTGTRYSIGLTDGSTSQTRDKLRVWSGGTYTIGMKSGFSYGHLNDYAMSFQMNSDNDRGWWWGDTGHSDAQGAMSLTTNGRLTVATSLSIGQGESVTSPSTEPLYLNGNAVLEGDVILGTYSGTTQARLFLTGTTANKQSLIQCTNGNLHIDSEDGHSLYLNYYEGTTDNVIIGNGNGGASGTILKSSGRVNVGEHLIAANSVYAAGNKFVFGSSTTEGEYIQRNGNNIEFIAGGGIKFDITSGSGVHVRNGSSYFAQISNTGEGRFGGDVTAYYNFSDKRLKTNIKPITGNLDKVLKLNPVEYNWKEGYRKDKKEIGLIAQEVEKIIPEVVREKQRLNDDTLYKQVDYEHLVSTLIGAVQEQQKQIDELKSIINGSS